MLIVKNSVIIKNI